MYLIKRSAYFLFVKYTFNEQFDGEINKNTHLVTRNYPKLACFLPELA